MKIFLKKALIFSFLLTLLILFVIIGTNSLLSNSASKHILDSGIRTLILGDSHSEKAYDDAIIPNSINISQGGDSYFYIYLKAKQLIAHNPQLKRIIVNFSNNQIDAKMNERIWDDLHLSYKFVKLSAYADFHDHFLLFKNNQRGYLPSLSLGIRKNLYTIFSNKTRLYETKNWGGYEKSYKVGDFSNYNLNNNSLIKSSSISTKNIEYLKKIVSFCKERRISLYLIRTPVHPSYIHLRNDLKFDSIYKKDFNDIPFIDLKKYPLNNTQFEDASHVNYKGSNELSIFMKDRINRGLWEMNKQMDLDYSLLKTF